jgi:hypothetical protein
VCRGSQEQRSREPTSVAVTCCWWRSTSFCVTAGSSGSAQEATRDEIWCSRFGPIPKTFCISVDHDTLEDSMISTIRFDGASEFGSSSSFRGGGTGIAYCNFVVLSGSPWMDTLMTKIQELTGRSEFAKNTFVNLRANLPRRFWHFCRPYAFWLDGHGLSVWEKLDSIQHFIRAKDNKKLTSFQ